MEDGLYGNLRVGAIIQARFDSTRFSGKVLKNLPFNSKNTVLSQIYNRLLLVKEIDDVIIATSVQKNDDIIYNYCVENNFLCERGFKEDVLGRFVQVINTRKLDVVIRITGDNPIVLIDILKVAIKKHIEGDFDYTRNNNLPYGTSFEIINAQTLKKIYKRKLTIADKEHVTLFIKNNKKYFKIQEIQHQFPEIDFRFTVDYPSDYAVMNIVFQELEKINYLYDFDFLSKFIFENQWIKCVNSENYQKRHFLNFNDELNEAIGVLEKRGLTNIADLLKKYNNES